MFVPAHRSIAPEARPANGRGKRGGENVEGEGGKEGGGGGCPILNLLNLTLAIYQSNSILPNIGHFAIVSSIGASLVPFLAFLGFVRVPSFFSAAIIHRTFVDFNNPNNGRSRFSLSPPLTANSRSMPPALLQTVTKSWRTITSFTTETETENAEIAGEETTSELGTNWTLAPNALSCPSHFDKNYCFNGGGCYLLTGGSDHVPMCRCSSGFHGHRCEYSFSADLFGMDGTQNDQSTATGENGNPTHLTTANKMPPPSSFSSLHPFLLPALGMSVLLLVLLLLLIPFALRQRCSNDGSKR
ncbi:hypothetical protein niasHT_001580 [Heterodera trifolii]|uniref:EGF-like domain-containing protein n=1 Tax=Heterodera trifolii TaxID=157864 RepID=A0ABD2MB97_9BILA